MTNNINIGREINMFISRINRHINNVVSKYGITGPQAHILNFVHNKSRYSDVMQKDIEKEFDIRRSSTTNALQILEKKGLIVREAVDYDARLKKVILTEEGAKIQKVVKEIIMQSDTAFKETLTQDELEVFTAIISKLSGIYENKLKTIWSKHEEN